ncbi:hypothetical protein ACOBQJ_09625 [Pelotomaculum propionicicum]|uniref:hypothetical protein n=1 Tax=Pelotomaculum propionicicum TaxID=258475 RepID=UPI003B7C9ABC
MNKNGLDEMQTQRKNKIGNQTFLMLLYLLLLDAGLYGFGFRWVGYPANIMIILTVCSAVYVVRLIAGNAYAGPSAGKEKTVLKAVLAVFIAVFVAACILVFIRVAGFSNSNQIDDMAAPILFITAFIALIIAITTSIIKRIQNKNDSL